jgi:hypothetical protein
MLEHTYFCLMSEIGVHSFKLGHAWEKKIKKRRKRARAITSQLGRLPSVRVGRPSALPRTTHPAFPSSRPTPRSQPAPPARHSPCPSARAWERRRRLLVGHTCQAAPLLFIFSEPSPLPKSPTTHEDRQQLPPATPIQTHNLVYPHFFVPQPFHLAATRSCRHVVPRPRSRQR